MPDSRVVIAAAMGAGLLVGYAVSGWLHRSPADLPTAAPLSAEPEAGDAGSLEAEIAALRAALDDERGLRGALEVEIEMLRQEVAREAAPRAGPPPAPEGREGAPETEALAHGTPAGKEWFDEAALVERGVDDRRAAWLRERFDALQMDELYLRDEAAREGWLGKSRYHRMVRDLRAASREEIGDEDYDLLLYASGRDNRVLLSDVLQNSPAAEAGIEPGDILDRYDDRAIFSSPELISATRRGAPGSTVPVDLVRDGERLRLYVPQGPLGVRIRTTRLFPGAER
jgi:membrane-associated protease RseP (regulator of RpoE activity)